MGQSHFGVVGLSFMASRGDSRPARSFRHKLNCSTETVRDTAKVSIEH